MSGRKNAAARDPIPPPGAQAPNVAKVWFARMELAKSRSIELPPRKEELSLVDSLDQADLVLLTKRHYEHLVERAEVAEAASAYNETRQEETFPAEVLDRMLDGEAPVKVWREYRGMKQQHLAAAIGIGKSHLSEVESGKANLSLATLRAAARALNVDPVMLFVLEDK